MGKYKNWDNKMPCQGIRVLDLSGVLAGPLTASFFAELGATVIKIENKLTGGDATRQWKLKEEDRADEYSAYYHSANYGKEIRLMDLSNEVERNLVNQILPTIDIIISNFQKKTAQKLGFEPDVIVKKYPSIIFAQLSAYSYDDPRSGYDLVMQGETGWISMTGTDYDHVAKLPVAIIDIFAAHQMKEAILLALLKKEKTGSGSILHISLYKSGVSGLANQASNFLNVGYVPKPMGTLHPNIAPYGDIFVSAEEKKFLLAVGSDSQFKKLWFTLISEEVDFTNFDFNSKRVIRRDELQDILQQRFSKHSFKKIEALLLSIHVPFCLIKQLDEVFKDKMAKNMVLPHETEKERVFSLSNIAFDIS